MTIKEFEAYKPKEWKCPSCQQPLDALDRQEPYPNGWCSDCYYEALGEEIEKHPIGLSIIRNLAKTKHKYQR